MNTIERKTTISTIKILPLNRKRRENILRFLLLVNDIIVLLLAFSAAYFLRFSVFPYFANYDWPTYGSIVVWLLPVLLLLFLFFGLYDLNNLFGGLREYAAIFNATTTGVALLIITAFIFRDRMEISRGWVVISFFMVQLLRCYLFLLFVVVFLFSFYSNQFPRNFYSIF